MPCAQPGRLRFPAGREMPPWPRGRHAAVNMHDPSTLKPKPCMHSFKTLDPKRRRPQEKGCSQYELVEKATSKPASVLVGEASLGRAAAWGVQPLHPARLRCGQTWPAQLSANTLRCPSPLKPWTPLPARPRSRRPRRRAVGRHGDAEQRGGACQAYQREPVGRVCVLPGHAAALSGPGARAASARRRRRHCGGGSDSSMGGAVAEAAVRGSTTAVQEQ